ncbi:MAG: RNA polymerase factor sigma-54 [Bacillota bacterium]
MAMELGFQLKQEQTLRLTLTPQLRQAIEILQFSSVELLEYLHQQQMENPLIELEGLYQYIHDVPGTAAPRQQEERDRPWYHRVVVSEATLHERLEAQLMELPLPDELKPICKYLIGNVDERGYLDISVGEAASLLGVEEALVEQAIAWLQQMDPPGVCARNLTECLLLQLRRTSPDDELALRLVEEALEELAQGKIQSLAQRYGVTPAEVQRAYDRIQSLNPHPGLAYSAETPRYLVPDVQIEKVDGEYVILMLDHWLPHFRINPAYHQLIHHSDEQVANYMREKLNAALWIAKSIEQRRQTLYRVVECLVEEQKAFLEKGPAYLRPLTLKQVAEKLGMHESTVSRATSGKYAQTPQGLIELKAFFTHSIGAEDEVSPERAKLRLKALIDGEDKRKPYSDQKLAELLQAEGICLSRRTVAKYREEMRIPSSAKRKRYG